MCGIAGTMVFSNSQFEVTSAFVNAMRDTMVHRGPDGGGTWISPDRRIGLGHRRLAIIDLSPAADQPMSNEDGSLWIVFNGEIYNHAEVRRELEHIGGHRWKTDHSDTEVVLHAFEQWGIECLQRFRGMFAIGLWDARTRRLWLVRDRIGVKPLYYSSHHGRINFASEIKALLRDPEQKRAVSEEGYFHYLSFLTTPGTQTMFEGIRKLSAGTWLCVAESGLHTEQRYWDVWDHTEPLVGLSDDDIAARLLAELRVAVQLRKVSDVPVGVFLSGGIDSSTNAALFSEGEAKPVKTFTVGYHGEYETYRNELHYARQMAEKVGAEHHELLLTQQDLLDFLPDMIHLQDEPIADPVCVPVYYVSKLARDHGVVVCQVGEGADELFCGYQSWKQALALQQADQLPFPKWTKWVGLAALRAAGKGRTPPYEWLRRGTVGQPVFWGGAEAFTQGQKEELLCPDLRRRFRDLTSWEALRPIRQRFDERAWDKSDLSWMSYLDLSLRLPELLLMRVDKMSMGVSLEGRVPFLDHKFVELAMSIPPAVKLRNGKLKYILKMAVRGLIPDELIDRKKQGFGVPVYEWFLTHLGEYASKQLDDFCSETNFLDRDAVRRLLAEKDSSRAWFLLNFAMWFSHYVSEGEQASVAAVN